MQERREAEEERGGVGEQGEHQAAGSCLRPERSRAGVYAGEMRSSARISAARLVAGSMSSNVMPEAPSLDRAESSPPCARAVSRATYRPSPMPGTALRSPSWSRLNGWKRLGSSCGFMPTPESDTETLTVRPLARSLTRTSPPSGEYLIPLLIRLVMIAWTRTRSTTTVAA